MNDETFSQLTYGTIIKIKDKSDTFSKDLFFISYICNEFIDVISNVDLQKTTLLIENGKIKYNGKWISEGHHSFPWEKRAQNAE